MSDTSRPDCRRPELCQTTAKVRHHRRRDRRQLPRRPSRRLGWTDMVLLDKGPLPNPGGSTGHASNFIFPTDHNKEMAFLTVESQRQYIEYGVNNTCGGIEVAREPERLEEFKRRMTSAKTWGIEAELLTPAEIKKLVPFINEEILLGGYYTPSVSCVDSLQTGTLMREEAVDAGALQVFANTEVLDIETETVPAAPRSPPSSPTRAASRPSTSPSRAACGARASRRWPAPTSRSRPPCTRWPTSARSTCSRRPTRRSRTRSSATWTRSATSASRRARWRSARYAHRPIFITPTTSRRTRRRRCRRPSCRSPTTTSTRRWSRRST